MEAIISLFSNIQCVANNHSSLETTYLSDKYNLDYIGKRGRTNKHEPKFKDIFEVDLNDYSKILLVLGTANFFGGVCGEDTVEKIRQFSMYKGKVGILCNDPRIKPMNSAKVINERFGYLDQEHVDSFEQVLSNASYMFPGKDLNKFYGSLKYDNFVKFDYFKEIFKKKISIASGNTEKKYDVVYYGDRRGSFRETQLNKYMPNESSNLLIGYKTKKKDKVEFIKKLKHGDLMNKLNECKVSLILADQEHCDNVVTFRFYETLASNCLAAIPLEFDPNRELIQDPVLKDLLYVATQSKVKKIVEAYSPELIKRQHAEYRRIMEL